MIVLGIDPGFGGALCWRGSDGAIDVVDMPLEIQFGKQQIDGSVLWAMARARRADWIVVEQVSASPQMGVVSAFRFGYGAGVLRGVFGGDRYVFAPAAKWKRDLGLSADKSASRARAIQLWPGERALFARVKDHGRAEAALLTEWFVRRCARRDT